MEADGGCERDVVHRMNEGYRARGELNIYIYIYIYIYIFIQTKYIWLYNVYILIVK